MAKRRTVWKEYMLRSTDDHRALQSAWQSSYAAFAENKEVHFRNPCIVITNLSERHMRDLARHADISLPDYTTGFDPSQDDDDDEPYEEWSARIRSARKPHVPV